jgi:hypothetical protein
MTFAKIAEDKRQGLKRDARGKLPFLIEFGNESDIVEYAKKWNPAISPQQLERVVKLFLDAKRERGHLPQPH